MNAKQRMYERIQKHGEQLNAIFNTGIEPVALCKKLRVFEGKISQLTEDECNTGADHYAKICKLMTSAKKILFPADSKSMHLFTAVFVNGDPRGYALKIKDEAVRANNLRIHRDMGGYGIIAPDLTND